MLLLHHDHHNMACRTVARQAKAGLPCRSRQAKPGAPGRTRTDEYEFTKLALLLLRHRGKMASTAGLAPATSTFARWRSDLTELRGQMASVVGLAPTTPGLKGRLLELLCIHGRKALAAKDEHAESLLSGRR